MYEGFATVYDHMMDHIPYEEWFEKIRTYLTAQGIAEGTLCELACGTGTMTEFFAGAGYQMIGVDRSAEMLAVAHEKKLESGADILYVQQDMENLELAEPVDAVLCVCDSMNYLLQEDSLLNTFARVKEYLKPEGCFLFDLKTAYCYRNIIGNQTWVEQDEEVSYIWENYFYEEEDINEYMLTIFRKQQDSGLYERMEEAHYQRAYPVEKLKSLLEQAGLTMTACYDDSMTKAPQPDSERIYVIAKIQGDDDEK